MMEGTPAYCSEEAIGELTQFCEARRLDRFLLVSDQNTYDVLGRRVASALRERAWDVRTVVLRGAEVLADERRIVEVLHRAAGEKRIYLAVGSGTVTDSTRFASHCARNPFISLPTAPSMDGYASPGAALVMGGFKLTVSSHAPMAIFANMQTLCRSPRELIAAGFGDMVGKYVALADWELAALLIDEAYSVDIAGRARRALLDCAAHAEEIGKTSATGIGTLMAGLLESGRCMAKFGNSRPASGAEHLPSHFWEMQWLQGRCPPALHGAKVGIGTVLAAERYEAIRRLTREDVGARLANAYLPVREDEIGRIRDAYGQVAERIVADHLPFLEMLAENFDALRRNLRDRWPEVREVAASVPPAREIVGLLRRAGGPSTPQEIGLGEDEVEQARRFSRYLRNRFTVNTVGRVLGMW
jgi:glycerol-1-phosphate dehydrogenase [NAD(P)+]